MVEEGQLGNGDTEDDLIVEVGWVDDGPDLWAVALALVITVAGPLLAFFWR